MWRRTTTKTVSNNKIQIDDSVSVTIPYRDRYLSPKEYARMPNDMMKSYWTLNAENNLDVIVLGRVDKDIDDEYTLTDLKNDYDNVVTIAAVSDNTLVRHIRNWKVSAK